MNVDIETFSWGGGVAEVFFTSSRDLYRYDRFFGSFDAEWLDLSYKKNR